LVIAPGLGLENFWDLGLPLRVERQVQLWFEPGGLESALPAVSIWLGNQGRHTSYSYLHSMAGVAA
jgi:hypothetical protein